MDIEKTKAEVADAIMRSEAYAVTTFDGDRTWTMYWWGNISSNEMLGALDKIRHRLLQSTENSGMLKKGDAEYFE